jgi:hypothetical protein
LTIFAKNILPRLAEGIMLGYDFIYMQFQQSYLGFSIEVEEWEGGLLSTNISLLWSFPLPSSPKVEARCRCKLSPFSFFSFAFACILLPTPLPI